MTDAQQRLADVRAAIHDILTKGQAITKDGRKLERAQLSSLRMLEGQYVADVDMETARNVRRSRAFRLYSGGKGV
ncbi:MAG: preprotein translocase subunit SecA [Pseudomonas sp.]|uniref:gpW family head-tail joining protein n=1 Tax=Pseudomonas sp. TaxID=306 RepID=UPI000CBF723F|nr:gpW family head-tail joining protein [Pseudomonas sp.]PJI50794.1 MAG: preprotein translocase subunit SecA [Pseudomonas sp.]